MFGRVSAVFLTIWFTIASFGLLLCILIPLITLRLPITDLYLVTASAALSATLLLPVRAYLTDAFLMAIDRHLEVSRAALTSAVLSSAMAGLAFVTHSPAIAVASLPAAVGVSLGLYGIRNARCLWDAIDHPAALFSVGKFGILGGLLAAIALRVPMPMLVAALAAIAALDSWFLIQTYSRFVRTRVTAVRGSA